MNIIILSTDDFLGAGKAALRMTKAFLQYGHNCKLIVKNKTVLNEEIVEVEKGKFSVFLIKVIKYVRIKLSFQLKTDPKYYYFGYKYDWLNADQIIKSANFSPDIIIVTWVSDYLSPLTLFRLQQKTNAKIIAYPLDMSLLTGGCHYAWNCTGYQKNCFECPAILEKSYKNLSHKILKSKIEFWDKANVNIVAPSTSLLDQAKKSTLFKGQSLIPKVLLPIDEKIFNSSSRNIAKNRFGINEGDFAILFGSSYSFEERKGLKYFLQSLNILKEKISNDQAQRIKIIIVGNRKENSIVENVPFKVVFVNYIKEDEILSQLYQASDIFVNTCIQDSGPMMVNESLMCGTPVISFNIGVSSDLIIDGFNGFKAQIFNIDEITEAILRFYNIPKEEYKLLSKRITEYAVNKTSYKSFNQSFENLFK